MSSATAAPRARAVLLHASSPRHHHPAAVATHAGAGGRRQAQHRRAQAHDIARRTEHGVRARAARELETSGDARGKSSSTSSERGCAKRCPERRELRAPRRLPPRKTTFAADSRASTSPAGGGRIRCGRPLHSFDLRQLAGPSRRAAALSAAVDPYSLGRRQLVKSCAVPGGRATSTVAPLVGRAPFDFGRGRAAAASIARRPRRLSGRPPLSFASSSRAIYRLRSPPPPSRSPPAPTQAGSRVAAAARAPSRARKTCRARRGRGRRSGGAGRSRPA